VWLRLSGMHRPVAFKGYEELHHKPVVCLIQPVGANIDKWKWKRHT